MPEYTEGQAGPTLPDGTYEFHCVDAVERESTQTHNVMIELQLDVFNADFTGKVRVVDRLVFTPNSYWKIDSFRKATGEKISTGGKVCFEAEDCIDRHGRCQLKTTSYNGKMRNEVDYYIEPDDQSQEAPTTTTTKQAPAPAPPRAPTKGAVPTVDEPF
jgi:hypothetical protein